MKGFFFTTFRETIIRSLGQYQGMRSDCGSFAVNQRQVPINRKIDAFAGENTFVAKEYIGSLFIREGTNTITVVLKENPEEAGKGSFILNRIYLEKI
jgi:hypothetical protein